MQKSVGYFALVSFKPGHNTSSKPSRESGLVNLSGRNVVSGFESRARGTLKVLDCIFLSLHGIHEDRSAGSGHWLEPVQQEMTELGAEV